MAACGLAIAIAKPQAANLVPCQKPLLPGAVVKGGSVIGFGKVDGGVGGVFGIGASSRLLSLGGAAPMPEPILGIVEGPLSEGNV